MKIQPSQISFIVNCLLEGGIASALHWRLLSNTDTSLRTSWRLYLVRLLSHSIIVRSARYAIEEGEVRTEKAPSFVKKEYSLGPEASSGRLSLHLLEKSGGHSEHSAKAYGGTSVGVRVQGRMQGAQSLS